MEPLKVRVPDAWRGMDHVALRQKMAEELDRMVREKTEIAHPDIGVIRVGRAGAKKSEGSARDPAKSLVAADIEALIPASIYARSDASRGGDGPDIAGYSTLLARVQVDGVDLVASFTVRHQSDGQWYYNAVALHDAKEKAQDSYGLTSKPVQVSPLSLGFPTLYAVRWHVSTLMPPPRWLMPPPAIRWWCTTEPLATLMLLRLMGLFKMHCGLSPHGQRARS
jgi:hypothetical protein